MYNPFHKHHWHFRHTKWELLKYKKTHPFIECANCGKQELVSYIAPISIPVSTQAVAFGNQLFEREKRDA